MTSLESKSLTSFTDGRAIWLHYFKVTACALIILLSSCGGRDASTGKNQSSEANVVVPETPAPLQPAGKTFVYGFDNNVADQIPATFHSALTGQGARAEWVIKPDPTAPSTPNVLAQVSADRTDYRFPLAIADDASFQDLELSA